MKDNRVYVERTAAHEIVKMAFDDDATKVQMACDLTNDCTETSDSDRCEAAKQIFE